MAVGSQCQLYISHNLAQPLDHLGAANFCMKDTMGPLRSIRPDSIIGYNIFQNGIYYLIIKLIGRRRNA